MIGRRERGRTEVQAAERSKKRAATEKALRDDDARVALIEAQKVTTCFRMPTDNRHPNNNVSLELVRASFALS